MNFGSNKNDVQALMINHEQKSSKELGIYSFHT